MQSEDMYDPGGEAAAAYEAMHLEATSATADPYASYYGPPAPPYMHTGTPHMYSGVKNAT